MTLIKLIGLLVITSLLTVNSAMSSAQERRYTQLHQITHLSGGWVAFSNGELYMCHFQSPDSNPKCIAASGLPIRLHTATALWADSNRAWVAYSDGVVYGCEYLSDRSGDTITCRAADGLP